jgi:diguanylate cyclase (GGDEF)-like protein/PAS domain S-box-containing protein
MKQFSFIQRILLPLLFVGVLSIISTAIHMFTVDMERIKAHALNEARELEDLLVMAESLVGEHVQLSMQILKQRSLDIGTPSIKGDIVLNNQQLADLKFGVQSQAFGTNLVDGVTDTVTGTATLFVKKQGDFVRIATSVRKKDGSRAIGTVLDPKGKAIPYLLAKKPFYGVVDILGEPYISGYEPIIDPSGNLIGAWYVGYKVDVKALDQAIKKWAFLQSGFAAITDYNNNIRFLSERVTQPEASKILKNPTDKWVIVSQNIPQWDFHAVIAYPAREAFWDSVSKLYPLLIMGGLFGLILIVLALQKLRQLVIVPLGGDPQTASTLVSRIEQGDFEEDGTRAAPGTLIGNMLKMRQRLREMLNELQQNAERLSVSSSVFAHAHDGIFITDAGAKITEVNPAFTTLTGYSREEALGRNPHELGFVYLRKSFFSKLFSNASNKVEWQGEAWCKNKNGSQYMASLDVFPVYDNAQQFQHYVGLFSDITQQKEHQKSLEHMAYHDPLTQLPNRALFSDRLQQAIARAARTKESVAICYFDLDNFKPINDKLGHEAGDQLLIMLAERLRGNLRETDTIARLGGDEFALLLCGLQTLDEYRQTLDRLLAEIETPFMINDETLKISASIGYTFYPSDNNPPDILLRHADQAMYQAKTNGGGHHHLFQLQASLFS